MLRELHIEGFRCFKSLHATPFGRVNLLVGKNSSGKTALLDAIELLVSENPTPFLGGLLRRQEVLLKMSEDLKTGQVTVHHLAAVAHLFCGHKASRTAEFSIKADGPSGLSIQVAISEMPKPLQPGQLGISFQREGGAGRILPLLPDGTLGYSPAAREPEGRKPVLFLSTALPDALSLSGLWDQIMLTDDEPLVIDALRIIEPRVERLAFRGEGPNRNIVVKLQGEKGNLLLGSLGDGMRRLLALALHLIPTRGGYLLVDEIDTGLHHSVMVKMWRLVIETAKRLDIQVFATTHSADCIKALAGVQDRTPLTTEDLMVHRVVAGMEHTISFTPEDLAAVAEFQGEVR